ncbi:IS3 family transposase [Planctomycetes bacterium Poly30]
MRKQLIDHCHPQLSLRRQSCLLDVNRNRLSSDPSKFSTEDLEICAEIDRIHMNRPYYGTRRMVHELVGRGFTVGRGRTRRLMRRMRLRTIYPRPRTSIKSLENKVYPYLLRDLDICRPNQVWCSDITYIPMKRGFAYLVVIMDWYSRAVLSWRISNTLDTAFCVEAFEEARQVAGTWPEIMNTDQGCQYTSAAWTDPLKKADVQISMDGKRRWIDNVMVERLWRSLKYEDIYLHEYVDLVALGTGVGEWIIFYNHERPHQSHDNQTPWSVWSGSTSAAAA